MAPTHPEQWLAVEPLGDRLAQARGLRRVHDAFHAGEDVGGRVRAVVAQSWARSGDAGVDPHGHLAPIVMDEREIEARWSAHPLYAVLPLLRDLLRGATSESGHMLVISDARGVLLWMEGHHRVIEATHDMHFVLGADWSERGAGTNALGTAIAVDHPVQIFSAEHYNRIVHPWQCSGAPIHDPATGEILGVIDLTGHLRTAHPHTLGLVTAAAGMAEAFLRHEQDRRDERLKEAYLSRIAGAGRSSALVRPTGHLVMAVPAPWIGDVAPFDPDAAEVVVDGDAVADVEPLAGGGGYVLWQRRRGARETSRPAQTRLALLGRRPGVQLPGGAVELTGRHAEILAVLALAGRDLTAEELTAAVYGDRGKPVTLRAEMSRLRRLLPGVLRGRPYGFVVPVETDVQEAERLLADGRLAEALTVARERLLPASDAPVVVEARERLEQGLRDAVLAAADPTLLDAWCASAPGQEDADAARRLLELLPEGDRRVPAAQARVDRHARRA